MNDVFELLITDIRDGPYSAGFLLKNGQKTITLVSILPYLHYTLIKSELHDAHTVSRRFICDLQETLKYNNQKSLKARNSRYHFGKSVRQSDLKQNCFRICLHYHKYATVVYNVHFESAAKTCRLAF